MLPLFSLEKWWNKFKWILKNCCASLCFFLTLFLTSLLRVFWFPEINWKKSNWVFAMPRPPLFVASFQEKMSPWFEADVDKCRLLISSWRASILWLKWKPSPALSAVVSFLIKLTLAPGVSCKVSSWFMDCFQLTQFEMRKRLLYVLDGPIPC